MVVPGRGGWGGWQSRETSIRERLRDTAELGFRMGLSSRSAQRRSEYAHKRLEDAQRTLRGAQRTLRGRAEDAQRMRRGVQEAAQRMCRGRSEARSGVVVGS